MDISTALTSDLRNLLRVLDLPDLDVEHSLRALRLEVQQAVPSFVGLSVKLVVEGHPVTLTSVDDDPTLPAITSSLRLPVTLTSAGESGTELIFYATTPGAFVDLAADVSFVLSDKKHDLRLDQDLVPPAARSGLTGVAELTMINRALGVLMGRGLSPTEAREQLEREAARSRLQVFQVAAFMISLTE